MIPVSYYRSSSITEWCNCPLRYFANHVLGLKYPSGPKALLGTAFQEVMEVLAHNQDFTDEQVENLTREVYDKMVDSVDFARVPPSSIRKGGERKSKEAWLPFRDLKKSVDNVMSMEPRAFDVRKMDVVATELKFDVEIKEPWARYDFTLKGKRYQGNLRLKGSIDLIVRNEDGTLSIIDWKSGKTEDMNTGEKKTFEDYEQDLQMAMYYMVTRYYLGYDISDVTLCFLNEKEVYTLHFDEDLVLDRIRSIYEEMQQCVFPEKIDSKFCMRFCPYSKNDFGSVTSLPLIKPRDYTWVDEDTGIPVNKTYKICGQLWNYHVSGYNAMQVAEALMRKGHSIEAYINT